MKEHVTLQDMTIKNTKLWPKQKNPTFSTISFLFFLIIRYPVTLNFRRNDFFHKHGVSYNIYI